MFIETLLQAKQKLKNIKQALEPFCDTHEFRGQDGTSLKKGSNYGSRQFITNGVLSPSDNIPDDKDSKLFPAGGKFPKLSEALNIKSLLSSGIISPPLSESSKTLSKRTFADKNMQTSESFLLANAAENAIKASDVMQLSWMKKAIDELCEDNAVLTRNLDDSKFVIEKLIEKIKSLKKNLLEAEAKQESKLFLENMLRESNEKAKLREESAFWKKRFFDLKTLVESAFQEEMEIEKESDVLIAKLAKENEYLRVLLQVGCSEEIEKEIDQALEQAEKTQEEEKFEGKVEESGLYKKYVELFESASVGSTANPLSNNQGKSSKEKNKNQNNKTLSESFTKPNPSKELEVFLTRSVTPNQRNHQKTKSSSPFMKSREMYAEDQKDLQSINDSLYWENKIREYLDSGGGNNVSSGLEKGKLEEEFIEKYLAELGTEYKEERNPGEKLQKKRYAVDDCFI